jgi:hypothetical protein
MDDLERYQGSEYSSNQLALHGWIRRAIGRLAKEIAIGNFDEFQLENSNSEEDFIS